MQLNAAKTKNPMDIKPFVLIFFLFLFISLNACSENNRIDSSDIEEGYFFKIQENSSSGSGQRSYFSGDKIGIALSAKKGDQIKGQLAFTDIFGKQAFLVKEVAFSHQKVKSDKPWLESPGFEVSGVLDTTSIKPGVYFAAGNPELYIVIKQENDVIRDSDFNISILLSSNTFNAYSVTDGGSFYNHPKPVEKVTFKRHQNKVKPDEWLPIIKWFLKDSAFKDSIKVNFITDYDLEEYKSIQKTDMLFVTGHAEYWTRNARKNLKLFNQSGGHLLWASGNSLWVEVHYEGENKDVLVGYKGAPSDSNHRVRMWFRDSKLNQVYEDIGADFFYGGFSNFRKKYTLGWDGYVLMNISNPLFHDTNVKLGECISFYKPKEYDGPPLAGFTQSGFPIPDISKINATKYEILGFDLLGKVENNSFGIGSMHVMKKNQNSGNIFHIGLKDISLTFKRSKREPYQKTTRIIGKMIENFVFQTMNHQSIFSDDFTNKIPFFENPHKWKERIPKDFVWQIERPDCQH